MTTLAYISFVFVAAFIGAALGCLGHFARAHFTATPEKIFEGGLIANIANDFLSPHSTMIEEHVVGAEWDDNGFWDAESNRNLVYYIISGFAGPIIFGFIFWSERAKIVEAICKGSLAIGLHSPFC
jgi:hypothetical protein